MYLLVPARPLASTESVASSSKSIQNALKNLKQKPKNLPLENEPRWSLIEPKTSGA
jgi:hypothetical protein